MYQCPVNTDVNIMPPKMKVTAKKEKFPKATPVDKLRSYSDAIKTRENIPNHRFPPGMPLKWNSFKEADKDIKDYCESTAAGEGGFEVIKQTNKPPIKSRGRYVTYECGELRDEQTNRPCCGWMLYIEEVCDEDGTYAVIARNMGKDCCQLPNLHTLHPFVKNPIDILMRSNLRSIPDFLLKDIEVCMELNLGPSKVFRHLREKCNKCGQQITFVYDDIKNYMNQQYDRSSSTDIKELFEYLQNEHERNANLKWSFLLDDDDKVTGVFFSLDELDLWNSDRDSRVVFLDSKHGTNRYNMKVACFTIIDRNGRTQVLAATIIRNESLSLYIWVMSMFKKCFGCPNVIFTDGDKQMIDAIAKTISEATHLRCVWHIFKNFYDKFVNLFKGDSFNQVCHRFWKIAKTSDIRYREKLEVEWNEMLQYMRSNASCEAENVSITL